MLHKGYHCIVKGGNMGQSVGRKCDHSNGNGSMPTEERCNLSKGRRSLERVYIFGSYGRGKT